MIYCDNSATTLHKPKEVAQAVAYAIDNFGNPSRSFNEAALLAARRIYEARAEIAKLIGLEDPLKVAFTSSATESLNLVINGLFEANDHIITTALDHNAVLRPLYNLGCELSFLGIKENELDYNQLDSLVKANTKAVICTHISNVTGYIVDINRIREFCNKNNLIFILDVSQSIGCYDLKSHMADIMCFTGHKSLFGPQGTGGIITNDELKLKKIIKTGGAGTNSFEKIHPLVMPDIFEVGTLNAHGINGLLEGVKFINKIGLEKIKNHKHEITKKFYDGIKDIEGIKIYGNYEYSINSGVIAINYKDVYSYDFAEQLYENHKIATRAQSHCAPLVHEAYSTKEQGMVRFSFSYFNTLEDIDICIKAIKEIVDKI